MLCDVCGKNQATVHLTEIVDEQMTELHLCEECARQKSSQMEQQFGLADLLAGLVDFGKHAEGQELAKIRCPSCNLSYEDFKKIGRLGCSNCYTTFIRYLTPLLKRIHGTTVHTGKFPKGVSAPAPEVALKKPEAAAKPKTELSELKNKLQEAVRTENFEEAARLRDKVKELEKKAEGSDKGETASRDTTTKKKREPRQDSK
ncbi:MAG: UvrB/UvrC motif-containing protein [Candidatus Omnitrophica bacterium]|nr:UvrB/UvrC motif-containing protein [Candidatus Omnitrophota bacterium]MDD5351926.1 UvrB/UvrC motif-containing protein [Candidatus Omnitrophota bacterium]MDD5550752.1 UvrB/UvrC motif-containing protein [Candidatus Omnitrophota bacterium]